MKADAVRTRYDEALAGLSHNVTRVYGYERPVLIEVGSHLGIWPECDPLEGLVYGRFAPAVDAAARIRGKHDRPWFMAVNFINPHDICDQAIRAFADEGLDQMLLEKGEVEVGTLQPDAPRAIRVYRNRYVSSWVPTDTGITVSSSMMNSIPIL